MTPESHNQVAQWGALTDVADSEDNDDMTLHPKHCNEELLVVTAEWLICGGEGEYEEA